jgi:L-malate glycosyltransferase
LRRVLEDQVRRLDLSARVRFVGPQPRSEIPGWLRAFDMLVLPSRETRGWKEQFGRVLAEAMAVGTPCVGSESGAIPWVIGATGHTFSVGDPRALALALEQTTADREQLAHLAMLRASYFGWDRFADETLNFIEHLRGMA